MRNFAILLVTAIAGIVSVSAQNKTSLLQRMNEIKRQTDVYYWDHATFPDADTAKVTALKRMMMIVNSERDDSHQLETDAVLPFVHYIMVDRASLKQCFVYARRSDVATLDGRETSQPVVEVPVADTPASTPSFPIITQTQRAFVPDAFVQRIAQAKDIDSVHRLLKTLQADGQVQSLGSLRNVADWNPLTLILFDMQSRQLVTILSPVTATGGRVNLLEGGEDALENYPTSMTAVIWYIKN